ncbi:MAG TPA: hypothetical protein PLA54_05495 [Spirochaetota bacterium]|nr:hypothetical protein [Spirochaetota bacterium]HQE58635.1 hypothetical protein [Spirochaetota bacterium]
MQSKIKLTLIFILTLSLSCKSVPEKISTDAVFSKTELTSAVIEFNERKAPSFSADVSLKIKLNGKSNSASGKIYYSADSEKWRAVIRDPYFGTVVFHILIENDIINAYSTYDKILFLSDAKSPDLFSATYNPSSIFAIVSGKIPLIAQLAEYKENIATLEYDDADFSQKINFSEKKKVSDLTIENKKKTMNFVIRYDSLSETDNYSYYKRIHAEETVSGDYFDFTYKNITIEKSISDSIFDLKIPKGTKVINTTGKL